MKRRRKDRESSPHVAHEPCPKCGSRDNLSRRADGSGYCFGCEHWEPPTGEEREEKETRLKEPKETSFVTGIYAELENRGLSKETCEKWDYQVNVERQCQIANYRDATGELVAQKLRKAGKKFSCINGSKDMPFYGMWRAGGDLSVVITEGELDAMSVSQAFKHKYAVVSLPNGVKDAAYNCQLHYEWLSRFKKIILMFDQDEHGLKAVQEAAEVLPIGKVHIAVLPRKDANEVLIKDGAAALVDAFWKAANGSPWRPDGIISGEDISVDDLMEEQAPGYELHGTPDLNEKLMGLRKGELTLLTAGSGIGKSTWARQLAYMLSTTHGLKIGNIYLEEQYKKTAKAYVALHHSVPLSRLRANSALLTREQYATARDAIVRRMCFYNHFGSLEQDNLLAKLRYMATVEKCDFIILDHISIVTSGMESSSEGERKDIDILMTRLAQLVQETGVGIIAICHLKRAKDKSFNEGSTISLSDLRGSAALEQLSFNVLALERDQQADDDTKDQSVIRVLKCRETGDTGVADTLIYNRQTGWLNPPLIAGL
ncbi:toprim domain-containing protein [Bradyrhizobium sp. KB893862 SZCCT0404]|uniref:DnaB-like helicase C-terminal domain-containing protein n=1 Tax=Bradyrhizobium sp. KB893862 SZCCT0404 TaxID=2807672 RepID=UPI001BAAA452|nr:DnaB-like helicase C-terminal domain-containing protein [Bradyrhizobium sp. KB893862 SZCCT0404]MBR1173925.1 toprim domain-containing protein [Bradyrhizobium sp. KB893862 SZCCT0404]